MWVIIVILLKGNKDCENNEKDGENDNRDGENDEKGCEKDQKWKEARGVFVVSGVGVSYEALLPPVSLAQHQKI